MITPSDLFSFKAKVYKLKNQLNSENVGTLEKLLADKYLNEVLFLLEELKL